MSAWQDAERPRGARIVIRTLILCTLLAFSGRAFGDGVVLGAVVSAGQGFAYGSYLDARTVALSEYGTSAAGSPGTVSPDLFMAWGPGIFADIDLADWLSIHVEARYSFLGAAYLASTAAGVPFDAYGVSYDSVVVPILARARLSGGAARFTLMAGPILGFAVSPLIIVDRYAQSTATAVFPLAALQTMQIGVCAGAGCEIVAGTGVALIELRTDVMLSSVSAATGSVGGEIMSVPVYLTVSYGFRLGGAGR